MSTVGSDSFFMKLVWGVGGYLSDFGLQFFVDQGAGVRLCTRQLPL